MNYTTTTDEQWDISDDTPTDADSLLECLTILTRYYGNPFSQESLRAGIAS